MNKDTSSKDKDENGRKLLKEALDINERQILLMKDAEFNFKLICEWLNKNHNDDSEFLSDTAYEALNKEGRLLWSRLRISVTELKKLDKEYNLLCERVNTYYNKELMTPASSTTEFDTLLDEIQDTNDWWKKES